MRRTASLLLLVLPLVAAACGGSSPSAFPEPEPCPTPAPDPRTMTPLGAYFMAVRSGPALLTGIVDEFRGRWPSGRFSRKPEFREQFRVMADRATCAATTLLGLQRPPGQSRIPVNPAFEPAWLTALDRFIATMADGREGVEQRNVSDYRSWTTSVEARLQEVRAAADLVSRQPGQ